MTSRATIRLNPPGGDPARPWHLLRVHCESLHRSGLDYHVRFDLPGNTITVTAEGQPIPRRRAPPAHRTLLPDPMTPAHAQRGLACQRELERTTLDRIWDRWRWWRAHGSGYYRVDYSPERERKQARFGAWLASRIARQARRLRVGWEFKPDQDDYRSCDEALGWKCPRLSKLNKRERDKGWIKAVARCYLGRDIELVGDRKARAWGRARAEYPSTLTMPDLIREYRRAKIDLEYWGEMVRLTNGGAV